MLKSTLVVLVLGLAIASAGPLDVKVNVEVNGQSVDKQWPPPHCPPFCKVEGVISGLDVGGECNPPECWPCRPPICKMDNITALHIIGTVNVEAGGECNPPQCWPCRPPICRVTGNGSDRRWPVTDVPPS